MPIITEKGPNKLECFWLCNSCRRTLTVVANKEKVVVEPLELAMVESHAPPPQKSAEGRVSRH